MYDTYVIGHNPDITTCAVSWRSWRRGGWCEAGCYSAAETGTVFIIALRQGFRSHGFLPIPPELVDPDPTVPSSPPYSPPPYSSEDEAPSSGDSAAAIQGSLISSTHDLPPAPEAGNYCTLTLLRPLNKKTSHSEELEEKPVVDATATGAAMLEGSQEVRSEGQSAEEKPATDGSAIVPQSEVLVIFKF
ncbi:hypothetical protein CYMTET_44521 [Cymbomonas tetramitiformis]|uniref:Uncharacterized protein n=1 Tax=Cymbomonas tetramitiformis TaxID=36881 RepID=A0AAE0EYY4_9CHLO|nr:hypothetical protein CYMTET_44521 [Cymbomonas tetramitiformis]